MLVIKADRIIRPRIQIEEIQSESGLAPGRQFWSAIWFVTKAPPEDIYGKHDKVQVCYGDETWELTDANIVLAPLSARSENRYVVTFEAVKRVGTVSIHS